MEKGLLPHGARVLFYLDLSQSSCEWLIYAEFCIFEPCTIQL